mmetsp:Transcript_3596/g.14435  ORF Transcript_3596/g.14435 Transcript_3596/m.14435 type:complete len:213 (+) Transcript_3596:218-856(+)
MPRQSTCARAVHPPQRSMLSSSSSPSQTSQQWRTGTSWWAPLAPSALAPEASRFFWFRFGNTCCRCRLPRPSSSSPAAPNLEALDASRSTSATPFPPAASVDPNPSSSPSSGAGSVDVASPISPSRASDSSSTRSPSTAARTARIFTISSAAYGSVRMMTRRSRRSTGTPCGADMSVPLISQMPRLVAKMTMGAREDSSARLRYVKHSMSSM